MQLLSRVLAVAAVCAVAVSAHPKHNPWKRVPGGQLIHESCIYSVESGHQIRDLKPCAYIAKLTQPQDQIYAIDVHYTPSNELMSQMNTSFVAPALPLTRNDGQVVYFWPGFKSTAPTMGLPVLQPVLQYGEDCCGGGDYWCVRSWFVYGDMGIAYQSAELPTSPGDLVNSWMSFDAASQLWTINAVNTKSGQNTTLFIDKANTDNTDFAVAMIVLEVIMELDTCGDLPASNAINFSNIQVNGKTVKWTERVQSSQCQEHITNDKSTSVTFNWNSKADIQSHAQSQAPQTDANEFVPAFRV